MAEIFAFPRPAAGVARDRDNARNGRPAIKLLSALEGAGKTLADLLLVLLAELEDSSVRLSRVIERTATEAEKRVLRAEQQEIRTTIAELRKAIDDEVRTLNRV